MPGVRGMWNSWDGKRCNAWVSCVPDSLASGAQCMPHLGVGRILFLLCSQPWLCPRPNPAWPCLGPTGLPPRSDTPLGVMNIMGIMYCSSIFISVVNKLMVRDSYQGGCLTSETPYCRPCPFYPSFRSDQTILQVILGCSDAVFTWIVAACRP